MEHTPAIDAAAVGAGSDTSDRSVARFWLVNFQIASVGGAILFTAGLVVSFLAAFGAVPDSRSSGLWMAGLLSCGLAAWLWAAHAMDRVAASKWEK